MTFSPKKALALVKSLQNFKTLEGVFKMPLRRLDQDVLFALVAHLQNVIMRLSRSL